MAIPTAIPYACSGVIIARGQSNNAMARASMLPDSQAQLRRGSTPSSKVHTLNKVFEDQAKGIVCYRDQKGELVCEGYDEGPRFNRQPSQSASNRMNKHLSIPDFLHKRWLVVEEVDSSCVKGVGFGEQN